MRRRILTLCCLAQLVFGCRIFAQSSFALVQEATLRARLDLYKGSDKIRETALLNAFTEAGCSGPLLSEQVVPKRKEPNVICVLPGETSEVVLVGAHFDHVTAGDGVVDNWSGASLLPTLFQSLAGSKRRHTFVFIGFTGEESGEIGSTFYVSQLSKDEVSRIGLMITVDSVGLGPTKVWASRADKYALGLLGVTASRLKLPIEAVNMDGYGESDEEPFIKRSVRTITVHSLPSGKPRIIHTRKDTLSSMSFHDYYDTYRLLATYLVVLDAQLDLNPATTAAQPQ